jgi:hypothetical protein
MSKARNLSDFISDAAIDATEIGSNAVTTDKIIDQAVTPAKLHNTLDLSSKTVTLPTGGISGNAINGGVISNFASTGIDDNASATAVTIASDGKVGIGTSSPTGVHSLAKVLELDGGDGSEINLGLTAPNVGSGAFVGGIGFKNIDGSLGTAPHYAGIKSKTTSTLGTMDLRFYSGTGNYEADTPQMLLDASGNLLVGTTSTLAKMTVIDTTDATKQIVFGNNTSYYGSIGHDAGTGANFYITETAGNHKFMIGTTERMQIDNRGNVGIGVTPVTSWDTFTALQIEGSALGGLGDNNTILGSNLYHDNNAFKYIGSATASIYQQRLGEHRWYGAASGTAGNTASLTQHMTIDSSGSVGIGSTNPIGSAQSLHIQHPAGTDTALPTVKITRANNVGGGAGNDEIGLEVNVPSSYNQSNYVYGIKTYAEHNLYGRQYGIYAEVEKANSNNSYAGYFKGGHSDTNGNNTPKIVYIDQKTNVGASNTGYSIGCMIKQDDYVKNEFMCWETDYSGSWTMNALRIRRNNSQIGGITTTISSTSYNTSSDYRLKENITDVTDGITRVKQLAPKRFNFIAEPDKFVDGFIAHEAQAVVPEAVTGTQDALDAEGNPDYQGIDQSKLVPLLTAALQEAIAKIEILETEMTSAKARIAALEE